MTKQEELKAYKIALDHYLNNTPFEVNWGTNTSTCLDCGYGFCYYFLEAQGINLFWDFESILPTLYSLKPLNHDENKDMYWFPDEASKPRIKLLKKAIEILEKELK